MSASSTAVTIRNQIGPMGLGTVGAHKLGYTARNNPGLTFKARLHYADQTRVRIMRVTITLNALDLYDIDVLTPDLKTVRFAENVYADQLRTEMYRLDSEGVPK